MEDHVETVRMNFENLEDFRQCIRGAELDVVQLRRGRFTGRMLYSNVAGLLVSAGQFKGDVRSRGQFSDKHVTLGTYMGDGARVSQWNLDALPGDIFFMPPGAEQEGRAFGVQSYATVSFSPDALDRLNILLGAPKDSAGWERPRRYRPSPLVRAKISERITNLVSHIQHTDPVSGRPLAMLQHSFLFPFLAGMVEADDAPSGRAAQPGTSLVRKVEDWIEGRPFQAPHVIDICRGLGVPLRTLQRAFHESLGVGPARYLIVRRLARARTALMAADPVETSVTAIAFDHGFWELGRFAGYYRQMFGESPSETLRRNR